MLPHSLSENPKVSSRFFYGYVIAAAGFIIMTTMFSTRYAFGVFFKPVQTDFGWTRAMTSGAFSLSMIMEGVIGILMGGLNDRLGPRMILTLCGALTGLGCLMMSKITFLWQLYLFFGLIMGTGMSGAWVPLTGMVARWFLKRRGLMTGVLLTGPGLAALTAPPVAHWLISTYDWRKAFILQGTAVLVLVLLSAQLLRRDPSTKRMVPYGSEEDFSRESISERAEEGLSFREALIMRQFWLVIPMLFCFGFCMFTAMVHIVPYATDMGISPARASKALAAAGGTAILGRLLLGGLSDRFGSKRIFIFGFLVIPAAFLWLIPADRFWMLVLFTLAFGLVQGGMGASESLLVADIFGLRSHGLIYGVTACGFTLGAAVGPWLAGVLFDITGSYHAAFAAV